MCAGVDVGVPLEEQAKWFWLSLAVVAGEAAAVLVRRADSAVRLAARLLISAVAIELFLSLPLPLIFDFLFFIYSCKLVTNNKITPP